MSKISWALLAIFIVGFVLFIIGANIPMWGGTSVGSAATPPEAATIGYAGVYMFVGSIIVYLVIYIYKELTKPQVPPPPAQNP